MACDSCARNCAGRGVGVRGRGLLVRQRSLEFRLVGIRQLRFADLGVREFLVRLRLPGREVGLLGRRRLGCGARGRDRRRLSRLFGGHRGDRLRYRLGLIRRSFGSRLDVLGLTVLAGRDQALDLPLDLTGLAGLLVVVGLLQRLRRLRLDRRLHGRDERLLVERPRLLGVHTVDLRRLRLTGHIIGGGHRGVLRLLGLRRGHRVRLLRRSETLDVRVHLAECGVIPGSDAGRRRGRLQQFVGRQRSGTCHWDSAHRRRGGAAGWRSRGSVPAGPRSGVWCLRARLAERGHRRDRFLGRDRLLLGDRPRPEPGLGHRQRGCRRLRALEVNRDAGRLRRVQPLLHRVDHRFVPADLPQGGVDVGDGLLTGGTQLAGHQRAHRGVAGAPLQRQQGVRAADCASVTGPGPALAVDQSLTGLRPRGVGRLTRDAHAVLGLLRLRRGRWMRLLRRREALHARLDVAECGIISRSTAGRWRWRRQELFGGQRRVAQRRRGRSTARPRPGMGPDTGRSPSARPGRGAWRLRGGLAQRGHGRHRLRSGHRLLLGHRAGPEPGLHHCERGRRRLRTFQIDRHAGRLRRVSPFSTVSITGSSPADLAQPASMSVTARSPGERSFPAISALTAAFPALHCNANTASGPAAARPPPLRRLASARAPPASARAVSGV